MQEYRKARPARFNYEKLKTAGGLISIHDFWNLVKPFLSNKEGLVSDDISLVHNNQVVTDANELTEIFNDHYINIVKKARDGELVA